MGLCIVGAMHYHGLMSKNNNCLFDVYDRSGKVIDRMTGWKAQRRFGAGIWDLYTEAIDHSPWCDRPACVESRTAAVPAGVWSDPFMVDGDLLEPPF